jgi:hypothetical protein
MMNAERNGNGERMNRKAYPFYTYTQAPARQ